MWGVEGGELRDEESGKNELGLVTAETREGIQVNPTGTKAELRSFHFIFTALRSH